MKTKSNKSLARSLSIAKSSFDYNLDEEQGGFILKERGTENFEFVRVRNSNTGKHIARGLYTADKKEFAEKVLSRILLCEWEVYASLHTHPIGYPALPSSMDLRELFTGHPINFIYAPLERVMNMFTLKTDATGKTFWEGITVSS